VFLRIKFAIPLSLFVFSADAFAKAAITLPPHDAPATHWPWWLRILAVIAVLAFVRIVARSMRGGASGRGPGSGSSPE